MMKIRITKPILIEYSHFMLSSPIVRDYFKRNAKGSQKSMPKINQGIVVNTRYALPPLSEQCEIVNRVTTLLSIVDKLEEEVTDRQKQAKQLMQSVLKEAFNNKKAA